MKILPEDPSTCSSLPEDPLQQPPVSEEPGILTAETPPPNMEVYHQILQALREDYPVEKE